jgi:hypothetical protein
MTDVVLAQAQSQLNMTAALVLPGRAMAGSGSDLLQASVRSWVSCPPCSVPRRGSLEQLRRSCSRCNGA